MSVPEAVHMRVLVLSGEVTHTRPMSYGFPHEWDVRVLSLIDTEHLVLCEKYGGSKEVPPAETITFLKRAYDRSLACIDQAEKVDVVVGVGYGAQVLMNLSTACEWIGPSVYVLSEGVTRYSFTSRPLTDEIDHSVRRGDTAWISMMGTGERIRRVGRVGHTRKCVHEKGSSIQVNLPRPDWSDQLYTGGLLKACVDIVHDSRNSLTRRITNSV